nr:zinc-binding dehydrogenase [Brevibacterium sp. R8603A2]
MAKQPITIGHENAGVVAELGEGVTNVKVGDRVGVCPTTPAGAPGYVADGGFQPKIAFDANALVPIPDGVSWEQGAAATDAGMTSYHAIITNGQAGPGKKIGVIGFGGLGQIGARVAILAGAEVYVAEVNEKVWDAAKKNGAKGVAKSISEFSDVEFDAIIDYAGFGTTTAEAIETVRRGGIVVQVGMGRLKATISTKALILSEVTLIGSQGGTKEDIAGVYEYLATGELEPTLTTIAFEDIPDGLDKLAKGEVVGRLVALY